jgi:pimeloyl-ACP methyl ester carboxylesterase
MKFLTVSGTTRFYDDEGQGPAVIAVHGSMSGARQWRKLAERLNGRYRMLAPDLYISGEDGETVTLGAFSFVDDVALVEHLIALAEAPVHLIGHSYGGVVAVKTALANRDRLASLTLIEPSCFHLLEQTGATEHAEIMVLLDEQETAAAHGEHERSAQGFISYWMGPEAWPAMPERRRATITQGVPKLAEDWRGTLDHHTTLDDYRSLNLPVLLMRARDTKRPSARIVDLIAEALPSVELVEIAEGGHMSPLTNPEPVNDAIETFIAGSEPRGSLATDALL